MTGPAEMVAAFHRAMGEDCPGTGDIRRSDDRIRLHREETRELIEALEAGDLVGVARELADVVYAAYGTAYTFGFDLDAVIAEVRRANMAKRGDDGRIAVDAHGKALKPAWWRPPDVAAVIAA